MQLPCIIGSCSNRSVDLAGGAHLGELVTGTNKHYQGWLQHREKSWVLKNTFLTPILVWLKSNERAEKSEEARATCWLFSTPLKWGLRTKVLAIFAHPSRPPPCPYGVRQRTEDNNRTEKGKNVKKQDRNFKREKNNQGQRSKRTVGRMSRFQNLKAPS